MDRSKIAFDYLGRARDLGARASTTALAVSLALAALWLSALEPKVPHIRDAVVRRQLVSFSEKRLKALSNERNRQHKLLSKETEAVTEEPGSARMLELTELNLTKARRRLEEQKKYANARLMLAQQVTFKLLGFEFVVPGLWAPLAWSACALALLLYLARRRREILALYGKGLRILHKDLNTPIAELRDIASPCPFWVAPLPTRNGPHVPSSLLRSALGWDSVHPVRVALLTISLAVSLAVVLRVTFIGIFMTHSSPGGIDRMGAAPVLLACAVFWILLAISLWWFHPSRVADDFPVEARTPVVSRRFLLTGVGITGFALLSHALLGRFEKAVRLLFLTPRFVRNEPFSHASLPVGFYESRSDRRIYYVSDREVLPRALRGVPASGLAKISVNQMRAQDLTRVHPSSLLPWLHAIVHREIASSRGDVACQLLASALVLDQARRQKAGRKPNFQLYDLAASVSRDLGRNDALAKVTALAKEAATESSLLVHGDARRIAAQLKDRIEKWDDPESFWSLRRAASSKERSSPTRVRDVRSSRTQPHPPA